MRGTFSLRATYLPPRAECTFEKVTAQTDIDGDGDDRLNFLLELTLFLKVKLESQHRKEKPLSDGTKRTRNPEFRLRTSEEGTQVIINYLKVYPLFSSKALEYRS